MEKVQLTRPDLIIMDLSLPGLMGEEVIVRLKTDPSSRNIPVIVNTGLHSGSIQVARASAAGAAEIIYKPNNFLAFPAIVHRHLVSEESTDVPPDP